jgi:hypothetical protein
MTRRVLIVSPHFPPINAPDHQRVRMALGYFEQFGWQPTVLAVRPERVEGALDPFLAQTLPDALRVVRTGSLPVQWTRLVGVGSLAYRAGWHLRSAGDELLRRERFDLVFFSTTQFPVMALGPRWRRRFGAPYVLDFQDPWLSDYYEQHREQRPPGGRLKYGMAQWLARRMEPPTVRGAAHMVCVSSAYPKMFLSRYPDLRENAFTVLPFAASELDFHAMDRLQVRQDIFDLRDGRQHWVYAGVVIEPMLRPLRAFLLALGRAVERQPDLRQQLRLHFIGTDYVPGSRARKIVEPLARELGVGDLLVERPQRVPYLQALRCLTEAHALMVFGSDDPGYSASKIYPYVLARKPLIALLNEHSIGGRILRDTRAGTVITYATNHDTVALSRRIFEDWFAHLPPAPPQTDWQAFEPYTAREMTRRLCAVFERCVEAVVTQCAKPAPQRPAGAEGRSFGTVATARASKRVLIVSPHFPPINAPDHQRVRMALPYMTQCGWQPTVLAVRPEFVEAVPDPLLAQTLPKEARVVRTGALPARWTRLAGIGSLSYRAGWHLRSAGEELLRRERFDLVFFSTTQFPVMTLGPRWRRRFGVPYVLDFQDPWVSDYYKRYPEQRPPGGRLKYGVAQWVARRWEPTTVRGASHLICVSPAYAQMFRQRYADLTAERITILPFGGPESDFSALVNLAVSQSVFDPRDGREHWVYAGRGGDDMAFAAHAFFLALRRHCERDPKLRTRLRVHFIGTDYAPAGQGRKTIEPLARKCGVGDLVTELPARLPYFEALRCLSDAQALFVAGSNDPGYTASKLYPYILARKPLLAVSHEASSVVEVLRRTGAGTVVTFGNGREVAAVADEIYQQWFAGGPLTPPPTDWTAFEPYTAKAMTRRLCAVFDQVLDSPGGS